MSGTDSAAPAGLGLDGSDALTADLPARLRALAPRVTVVGDLLLDGWWNGHSERITREAPAPVVDVTERVYAPGGAANTAMNLAALGARVSLVGLVGPDESGERVLALLEAGGVDVSRVLRVDGIATTTKIRIVSDDQVLVRVDEGGETCPSLDDLAALARAAVDAAAGADALLLCDYGYGALQGPVHDALRAPEIPRPPLLVVDAHDPAAWASLAPDLVTPNAREVARLIGVDALPLADRAAFVTEHAADVLRSSSATAAVVTLDRDGTVTLRPDAGPHRTSARPGPEAKASGAGDTFVATLTLARACGLPLELSTELAQAAADVVVQRTGTSVCGTRDLAERLGSPVEPVLGHDELGERLRADREAGRRIVFTNGCFDVLHRGHTTYLAQAAELGDVLVVAINSDDSVRRLKGVDRPVNVAEDRASVLGALGCVDYVTVFDTDTPVPLLERLRPDVYVKGGDYTPEMLEEAAVVTSFGGQVRMLGYVPSQSTTSMVNRIRGNSPALETTPPLDRS
ncbi:D-glycero-beta-D-manno-heptose 1-phosphate adenylyltransferase [Planctomonas deserti]|uniref:D-glycero-beta-D-manno-heptose 1-phosphate adenylyltransferase n=1 Tax=Planctomonas deserti TaxID=2144185 RepID=UPI00197BD58B|nr:D-glycero-beta-D-manno-heptose 1-phosphate adenylyltransferase [Planctomonas deserti]